MMPRSLAWVLVIVGLLCTGPVRASVWFSSIPSSVQSGTGYYVEASASGGSFNLTIYKNGGYFVGTSGSGWGSVGGSTTDYGAQSVQYWAELYDWNTMEYDNAYASVTITVDTTSPSVPAGLGGSSVTMTSFTLSWSASTDDTGVTEYEVRRDSTSLGTTGSTSMGITGLTLNTTYGMTVRARDAIGNWSDWSSVCNVTTANDTTPPSVPAGLSGGTPGLTSFTLSWSASSDNIGVTAYEVMRDTTSLGTTGATSLNVTGLAPSTTYAMKVRARDGAGNWSDWSSVCNVTTAADTTPPSVPTGLSGGTPGVTSFTLGWSASSDNIGVTAYEVMRDTTSLGTTGATSLNVTGLAPSTTYAMKVRARDAAGNWSDWSSVLNVTTAADTTDPSVPADLVSSNITLTSFLLSWSASTDNIGVTGYEVMRDTTSLGTVTGTSKNVTSLTANTTYAMKVQARDAAGNWSGWSSVLNVTTAADSDGDGLSNDEEIALGTNPNGGSSNTDDSSNTTLELKIHKPN